MTAYALDRGPSADVRPVFSSTDYPGRPAEVDVRICQGHREGTRDRSGGVIIMVLSASLVTCGTVWDDATDAIAANDGDATGALVVNDVSFSRVFLFLCAY